MGLAEDGHDAHRACVVCVGICDAHSQDNGLRPSLFLTIFTYASHLLAHLVR